MTQSEREQHMAVVRERDMWRERCERAEAENARLRKALGKVRRTALEKPFGEHTPLREAAREAVVPGAEADEERDVVVVRPVKAHVRR